MNWLRLLQSKIVKPKNFSPILFASLIVFISNLGVISTSQARSTYSGSNVLAFLNYFTSGVRILLDGDIEQTPQENSKLERYEDRIKVPGTPNPNSKEEFSHLLFKVLVDQEEKTFTPLIQAGPNYTESLYYYPCKVGPGDFMVGWNIQRVGTDKNKCDGIEVSNKEVPSNSQIRSKDTFLANKLQKSKSSQKQIIAQSSSKNISISPTDDLTLIHIKNNDINQEINVLLGSVIIKSPTQSFNLEQGQSYFNTRQGEGTERPSFSIYAERRVSIFLNHNYWSEEVHTQVQDFRDALFQNPLIRLALDSPDKYEPEPTNESNRREIDIPENPIESIPKKGSFGSIDISPDFPPNNTKDLPTGITPDLPPNNPQNPF